MLTPALGKSTFSPQVFHFLLSLLRPSRAKAEFRDCWPILDKKMVRTVTVMAIWWRCVVNSLLKEAEFRRKVVLLVKEVAKEVGNIRFSI